MVTKLEASKELRAMADWQLKQLGVFKQQTREAIIGLAASIAPILNAYLNAEKNNAGND